VSNNRDYLVQLLGQCDTHGWYEILNALAPYHGTASLALPYTLRYLAIKFRQKWTKNCYVPTGSPREDWVHYGRDSRSAVSFKENLGVILDLATGRGDRTLLMTFATYVPEDYSLEAFKNKGLDYGLHLSAIEIWGAPMTGFLNIGLKRLQKSFQSLLVGPAFIGVVRVECRRVFPQPCRSVRQAQPCLS